MVSSLLITGKDKIKTDDFNFSLGKSARWSIDLELLDDAHKEELINKNLAENIFKAKLNNIKETYSNIDSSDLPDWVQIEQSDYIKVR